MKIRKRYVVVEVRFGSLVTVRRLAVGDKDNQSGHKRLIGTRRFSPVVECRG